MRKTLLLIMCIFTYGCTENHIDRAPLPKNDSLVIAHRGASAYVTDHTMAAYNLAIQMGADYIELDLQMTKDGKLVVLHDTVVLLEDKEHAVADVTLSDLQKSYTPREPKKIELVDASYSMPDLRVMDLEEVLQHFGDDINYFLEIKSPSIYPDIEKKLVELLREHHLLDRNDQNPKVIIQSFNDDVLRKIFAMEPSIPLVKLYKFHNQAYFSNNTLRKLSQYASGVGVNAEAMTLDFVDSTQDAGFHVYPYTVNDEEQMRQVISLGVNGFFTDRPDVGLRVASEEILTASD